MSIYHLFVSGDVSDWGDHEPPVKLERSRCFEFTDKDIQERFSGLDKKQVAELCEYPCIFAYESHNKKDPKFGQIIDICYNNSNKTEVKIKYRLVKCSHFLSCEDLETFSSELEIDHRGAYSELNRTHWAVKEVNLQAVLKRHNIFLPKLTANPVNLEKHIFDVAISYPGAYKSQAGHVVEGLKFLANKNKLDYFFAPEHQGSLARPNMDDVLQCVYEKSRLIVVFMGAAYEESKWCSSVEWRVIKEILNQKEEHERIMYIKVEEGGPKNFREKLDGFIDLKENSPEKTANYILERLDCMRVLI